MSTHFEIEPIGRLWRLALPLIIANISTPILGLADAAISGHLDHAYYLAAVTVGAELLVVFFGGFSFLRMGTTGMVAQAVGADDHNLSFSILSHAIALAAIIGIGLFVLGSQAITPILELAQSPCGNAPTTRGIPRDQTLGSPRQSGFTCTYRMVHRQRSYPDRTLPCDQYQPLKHLSELYISHWVSNE